MLEKIPVERARGHPGGDACGCTDPDVIEGYLSDASGRKGAAEALFRPVDEAGVASVLRRAHREGAYVTVAAGQTSTTASSVPRGGWIVSTEKFQRMGAVDVQAQSACCEAGVILGAWQDDLLERGFLYPPDPTSRYECTVGGSVACNASGPRSHRFGATRRWVRGLRVVLACGEVLALRRGEHVASSGGGFEIVHGRQPGECALAEGVGRYESRFPVPGFAQRAGVKSAAGYAGGRELDAVDLFIGCEGTLGVITEVEVDLVARPEGCLSFFACFDQEAAALDLVERARDAGRSGALVRPDSLEWFDRASLDLIEADIGGFEIPKTARVAVFVEQLIRADDAAQEEPLLDAWFTLLGDCGAAVESRAWVRVARTADQHEHLRRVRHAVPAGVNERAARNGMPKLGTDLAVPDARLRSVVELYHRAAQEPLGLLREGNRRVLSDGEGAPTSLDTVTFGHVGDNHLHVNFLPVDARGLELAEHVYAELTRRVIALGGSPSAEHGIGKLKHAALRQYVGEVGLRDMLRVKRALDPRGVLGRGNLFELPADV